ncbi:acyl-CoA dehydrogenase family protein [Streptomonospora nanhaiensis]|uniref:Acyl-CoA dehydrogenase n=1 Tax=Streptomonospora nanhaiensis TaxID=1323731 RepID=A0A853BMM0_9ACTN|nr:acyl-CoA dehydrogenase family protein [Streptomonospora nanhaiensis]MBV2361919.1 acyl-CoA dehydrogenase family protein [Streptomonospora nanhaiensis]MBX9388629.1 acyl-CoA dehydrogenase family protein [Streptomonospora nanhaiensis]NYI96260.1 acyl-CoA dehydrogenase [Streptomonospora nanhaiensis]
MDFTYDDVTRDHLDRLRAFLDERILPAEPVYAAQAAERADPWSTPPVVKELQAEARERGLWNLFLPHPAYGAGLTNLQYAPLAELTGRSPGLAPIALNCAAPDTGNMEILAMFGTEEQRRRWLEPLLNAEIRSAFCMTEPDVASSDAANIRLSIRADGGDYVLNGRKWWTSGALSPDCRLLIVMGVTDPGAEPYRRQSMVLVPRDTPGVEVRRGLPVFGYADGTKGGHAEVVFTDVRVPKADILLGEGEGFRIAQERLGPGRVHHCMRTIGVAELALELMCRRAADRVAFGRPLADQGVVRERVAEARVGIEQARLLVLKTAWLMDTVGNKGARTEISAIKAVVPRMAERVLDDAIQVHGGAGVSDDVPLARLWAANRTLRLADGPDEVHLRSIARRELRPYLGERAG